MLVAMGGCRYAAVVTAVAVAHFSHNQLSGLVLTTTLFNDNRAISRPMQNYQQHLSPESLDALSVLLDSEIQFVISHDCDINAGSAILTVTSLSIPIGKAKFVIVENDWADTPINYLDYYFLSTRIAPAPLNIYYVADRKSGGVNYKADHLTLHLGAKARVKRIDVLSTTEIGRDESVCYDAGLLIMCDYGIRLAVVRQESISGCLFVAHTEADIAELTTGLIRRELRSEFPNGI